MELLRKNLSGMMLALLLTSVLTSASNIQQAEASGTIYIRADGSIDPPTAPIFTVDNITYTFIGNISYSIVVERSNIILDGNGFTLQGSESGQGVRLDSVNGSTLMDMNVQGFDYGIYLHSSSNNTITGNTISHCSPYGIGLYWSSFNTISHNNIADNIYTSGSGITIHSGSNNNKVTQNNIKNHDDYGIVLWGTTPPRYNEVYENNITDCRYIGIRLDNGPNYVFRNHLMNMHACIAGYVAYNNSIYENYIENGYIGVLLQKSSRYNMVFGNIVINNTYGIAIYSSYLATSLSNYIFGNEVRHGDIGLRCSGQDNRFYHNNVFDYVEPAFSSGIDNVWDDGYPSGGNYWSNYTGTDLYSGPYQNETGGDGIGDTPYPIRFDSQDNYPLMNTWAQFSTPVVLVHGMQVINSHPEDYWRAMKQRLERMGFEVYVSRYAEPYFPGMIKPTNKDIKIYAKNLAREIEEIKEDAEVDKVDIVAHSMGGLVSRYYIQSALYKNDVRKLIMLGTPNQGTELLYVRYAAWALQIYLSLQGTDFPIGETVDSIIGEAGEQMMPGNDFLYKTLTYFGKPNYYTIAGTDGTAEGILSIEWWCYWILRGIAWMGGIRRENDGAVRAESVKLLFPMPAENHEEYSINHDMLKRDNLTINKIFWILSEQTESMTLEQRDTTAEFLQEQDTSTQEAPIISERIYASGQNIHEIPISATSEVRFNLFWQQGNLNLTLISPTGELIDPAEAESDPAITYHQDPDVPAEAYNIENPEQGIWTVNISAAETPEEGTDYAVMTFLETNLALSLHLQEFSYDPSEPLVIKGNLTSSSEPITGATVTTNIQKPDDARDNVTLYDDGFHNDSQPNDGVYGNTYTNTSLLGPYHITVTATGTANSEQFARETFATVWVKQYPDLTLSESDIQFSNEIPLEGETITINATIHNVGEADAHNASILFYVGTPADGTLIGEDLMNVTAGQSETASVQWTAMRGTHQIHVMICPYNEFLEQNYTNNIAHKTIEVRITGDVDGDGDVDPDDFAVFAGAYGSSTGDSSYNPACDFDGDGDIDPDDFAVFAGNYGKTS